MEESAQTEVSQKVHFKESLHKKEPPVAIILLWLGSNTVFPSVKECYKHNFKPVVLQQPFTRVHCTDLLKIIILVFQARNLYTLQHDSVTL